MIFWTDLWWWWLLAVAVSFVALELTAVWAAGWHATWTLSDTIRRWARGWRPLAPLVIGTAVFLLAHWFLLANPGP